ncbi:MAG: hypothetical protein HUU21_06135 [Polyangiaceae bacterium]|nr:hypothetical protein [Polyangiaceae bacterium]
MLTIRRKNQAVLVEALQKGMAPRLVKYILCRFPDVFGKDARRAEALIDRVIEAAKGYGITQEADVAVFADLSVMYGEEFHRDDWALEVLADEELSPRAKMDELRDRVFESGALM